MKKQMRKYITWYLILAMFIIGITPRVYAGFSPSEVISTVANERSSDLQKIQKFLEMKMIRERFKEFGLTPDEIQTRLTLLNDQQIHQLALKVDDLKVGADSGLGIIIGLLVAAILVIILVKLLGHDIIVK